MPKLEKLTSWLCCRSAESTWWRSNIADPFGLSFSFPNAKAHIRTLPCHNRAPKA